jgi:DNA-binding IclR family transcriptional regulator
MGRKISTSTTTKNGGKQGYPTPALDKGLDILELLAHKRDGSTKSEIARSLNRTVSEIFRMLLCLERRGYISATAGDRYVLSLRLFRMVQEHPPTERLLIESIPRMHTLVARAQQSCHLGVLEAGRVVILAQSNAHGSVGFYVKAGSTVDLMKAATGQVILAHIPEEQQYRVMEEWRKEAGKSVPKDLIKRLERIRQRGYEKRASYQVRGITNISFPIVDAQGSAVAALTVPHIQRLDANVSMQTIEMALAKTCREISTAIGWK